VPFDGRRLCLHRGADLIPELKHDRSIRALVTQTALISLGIGVMALLTLIR